MTSDNANASKAAARKHARERYASDPEYRARNAAATRKYQRAPPAQALCQRPGISRARHAPQAHGNRP